MSRHQKILLTILILTALLRAPSWFEPWWYGDEGISGAVAQAINAGGLLYADAFDNKPPLTYLFFAVGLKLFGPSLAAIHFLTTVLVLFSQFGLYLLAKKISPAAGLGAAAILGLLLATPLLEGNSTNGEILMLGAVIWGFVVGWDHLKKDTLGLRDRIFLTGAGFLFGLGMMFKFPGVFDFASFAALLLLGWGSFKLRLTKVLLATGGFVIPYGAGALFFLTNGRLGDYLSSTFFGNVSYVGFGNYFLIPQGLLLVKALPVVTILFFALKHRDLVLRYPIFWLGLLWLSLAAYGALLGGRAYNHYFIQTVPALSLCLAALIWGQVRYRRAALTLAGTVLLILGFYFARTAYLGPNYYSNFLDYVSGQKSEQDYRNNFDQFVDRDYKVAEYLKSGSTRSEPVLIWSNNAQIYVLSERLSVSKYFAAYLAVKIARDEDEVVRRTEEKRPKFIVVVPSEPLPSGLIEIISSSYQQEITISDATIYRRR